MSLGEAIGTHEEGGAPGRPFKIEKLDILRALSAAVVVLYHTGFNYFPPGFGVLAFFVISGFLITFLMLRENESSGTVSLKNFYIRRSLRIFPAFYVYWLVVVIGNRVHHHSQMNWPQAICSLFYVTNYYQGLHGYPSSGLSHTWSLSVEEQFYLLWPWVFYFFRNRLSLLKQVLLVAIPLLWVYRFGLQMSGVDEAYIYTAFETRVDAILVGGLLAILIFTAKGRGFVSEMRRARYLPIPLIGLALSAHAGQTFYYRNVFGFAIDPVLVALLIGQLTAARWGGWMDSAPISYLGRISYSTYLYQQIIHPVLTRFLPERFALFAILPAVWLVAAISYECVEKPFLRLKKHFKSGTAMGQDGIAVAIATGPSVEAG